MRKEFQNYSEFEKNVRRDFWNMIGEKDGDESSYRLYRILNGKAKKSDDVKKENFVKATEFMVNEINFQRNFYVGSDTHFDSDSNIDSVFNILRDFGDQFLYLS